MQTQSKRVSEQQPGDAVDQAHPAGPWAGSNTGEGAASALKSLQEMENKRRRLVPPDGRPTQE